MIRNKSILLVEDDIVDVMTVKRAFKEICVENRLSSVSNGEEALEFLNESTNELPGLILLDLNMPKMSGLEFMRMLKKSEQFRSIPVIVMTTSDNENDRCESFKNSIAGYMVKPVDYDAFIGMVKAIKEYWTLSEVAG